ncbi:MAG: 16S rRNA (cytosine(1402)-N(4))-methyltransferase RsmH [Chitinispirillaceae bacterium]
MNRSDYHTPVLLQEVLNLLSIKENGAYLDGTLGGGGHFRAIAERLSDTGVVIGIDRDREALENVEARKLDVKPKVILEQTRFSSFDQVLEKNGLKKVDGLLVDLGVSSKQIDAADRGFSYMQEADLDMRMDQESGISARELLKTVDEEELADILSKYGEIRNPGRMARAIKVYMKQHEIETSTDLRNCIVGEYGSSVKIQVFAKLFQALRIAVNSELEELRVFLSKSLKYLNRGGRLAVISYHSLEDRMVKEFIREAEESCICPPELPMCRCNKPVYLKRVNRKIVTASGEEIERNPRSRSARLRVAERTEAEQR